MEVLTNRQEAEALRDGTWRQIQIARAAHEGIVAYATARQPFYVNVMMPGVRVAQFGARALRAWLRDSGTMSARAVSTGLHASSGRDSLRLGGVDMRGRR